MSKFEKGERFTLGNLTGTVSDIGYGHAYNIQFDGHVYENGGPISNNIRRDFFDAHAEKLTPTAHDRLKDLAAGTTITVASEKGKKLWGKVVFLRLANTDDTDRGQMIYGYAVGHSSAQEFYILNTDTITIE